MHDNWIANILLLGFDFSIPYSVTGCGPRQYQVERQLQTLRLGLEAAIADSSRGVQSTHGFQAFFKSNESILFVQALLRDVQSGRSLPFNLDPRTSIQARPQIYCANELSDSTGPLAHLRPWQTCLADSGTVSFQYGATPYIVLCPTYWLFPLEPVSGRHNCGTVTSNNLFANGNAAGVARAEMPGPNQERLIGYQVYHLFHEIVHLYLGNDSLGEDTVPEEVYGWNECVALETSSCVYNPMNYQLYLASKVLVSTFHTKYIWLTQNQDVAAGCTDFPKAPFQSMQNIARVAIPKRSQSL